MLVKIQDLLQNLNFKDLSVSNSNSNTFNGLEARVAYHSNLESFLNQVIFVLKSIQKLHSKYLDTRINWAIALFDVFPETNEFYVDCLLKLLKQGGFKLNTLTIFTRRRDAVLPNLTERDVKIQCWNSINAFSDFDFILLLCDTSYLSLLHDMFAKQQEYKNTIFMFGMNPITLKRAENICKSELVILPRLNYKVKQVDPVILEPADLPPALYNPDLEQIAKVLKCYYSAQGINIDSCLNEILGMNDVARLRYTFPTLEFSQQEQDSN